MDTRIATPLFDLVLPGAWTRSTPEPGLTAFRSPSGAEQLSISSVRVRQALTDDEQPARLREFVRVRRDAEVRIAQESVVSDVTFLDAPRCATFTAEDVPHERRSATWVLVRETGFVVLYLEAIGGPESFEDLAARLSQGLKIQSLKSEAGKAKPP